MPHHKKTHKEQHASDLQRAREAFATKFRMWHRKENGPPISLNMTGIFAAIKIIVQGLNQGNLLCTEEPQVWQQLKPYLMEIVKQYCTRGNIVLSDFIYTEIARNQMEIDLDTEKQVFTLRINSNGLIRITVSTLLNELHREEESPDETLSF